MQFTDDSSYSCNVEMMLNVFLLVLSAPRVAVEEKVETKKIEMREEVTTKGTVKPHSCRILPIILFLANSFVFCPCVLH